MSSIILKSLLVPENDSIAPVQRRPLYQAPPSTQENNTQSGLSRIDSLRISNSLQSGKGSVPINLSSLLDPEELKGVNQTKAPPTNKSKISYLQNSNNDFLKTDGENMSKVRTENRSSLKPISELQKNNKSTETSSVNSKNLTSANNGVKTTQLSVFNFVEPKDITEVKLNNAIDKIKVWDMKVGNLKTLMAQTNTVGVAAGDIVIATSTQVAKARTEAESSRNDAIRAYNDAITSMKDDINKTGMNRYSTAYNKYERKYEKMEEMYAETKTKHDSIWQTAKSWLWNNLQVAIDSYL